MAKLARFIPSTLALLVICGVGCVSAGAWAQSDVASRLSKLEQDVQRLQRQGPGSASMPAAGGLQDIDVENRLLTLEAAVQRLTGELEEARHRGDVNAEQLKVLTDDVNYRLATLEQTLGVQPGAHAPAPSGAPSSPSTPPGDAGQGAAISSAITQTSASSPGAAPAGAPTPGAAPAGGVNGSGQFVVRTDASGRVLPPDPNAPPPMASANAGPATAPVPRAAPNGPAVTGNQLAALPPTDVALPAGSPKDQYDYAFDFLKRNDYARGEVALRAFLREHPKDPLAGNAQYWLGQTFYARGNYQQAAVEFMAGYQNFPKNAKGPDNLLQLGLSLEKLNQSDGACTAFGRIAKDFPTAPEQVRNAAKTERTKLRCK